MKEYYGFNSESELKLQSGRYDPERKENLDQVEPLPETAKETSGAL